MNTNVSVSVLSRIDKQQIDSLVVKQRNIRRWSYELGAWDLVTRSPRQSARARSPKSWTRIYNIITNIG